MSKKDPHPKLDPYFISLKQKHEIDWVVRKFKKEGIEVTSTMIRNAVKLVGKSRRKVYNYLRKTAKFNDEAGE